MTNLLAVITFSLTTNWTTVSKTFPICDQSTHGSGGISCLVIHYPTENQTGIVVSNTVARFHFEGEAKEVILKSEPIKSGLTRSITSSSNL